jgi:hypothetical protein
VSGEFIYDNLTEQYYFKIDVDKFGACIYDSPETSYIDGIRINDLTVDSLKVPLDPTVPNIIEVRTDYKEDFTGTLAQIYDGTYDYANLLKNPVTLFMVLYYVLACILTITSIVILIKSKSNKAKTAEETAQVVDAHAKTACSDFKTEAINIFKPLFNTITRSQEAIVKSLVLTHSKDPNSHLEALESLRTISGIDVDLILTIVENELRDGITLETQHKQDVLEDLTKIAETTQGDSDDGENLPIL